MSDRQQSEAVEIDTSDVERWRGVPLGRQQPRYPVSESDIGRWAQAMHNPNPVYYDPDFAADSRFGGIVAPQSFTVAAGDGHGATPAIQGSVPGSHMLFGGDEWWFYGPRIRPGDLCQRDTMLYDYRVTNTRFAGPTLFSRGDTTYINQRGEPVAKQRSTAIRYVVAEALRRGAFAGQDKEPLWDQPDLERLEAQKRDYYQTLRAQGHQAREYASVKVGETLPERVLGPHTVASFTTEHRARPVTVWGAAYQTKGPTSLWSAGWLNEMGRDFDRVAYDPAAADGLYMGPSRGHVQPEFAQLIGMPRAYGYGSSMGGWILDYLENWASEWGWTIHMDSQYRFPAFVGDATILNGEVTELGVSHSGEAQATVKIEMTTQSGEKMATATAEVHLHTDS
ncbi:MAG TPA: MaoC family dehydratase N-terminal domain-containing protein [Acidimicrobiales bacterium]|nr:MaoC family dehydratase N-terminal domain-containing protein [Acidimicrobiales bacterium]